MMMKKKKMKKKKKKLTMCSLCSHGFLNPPSFHRIQLTHRVTRLSSLLHLVTYGFAIRSRSSLLI